MTLDQKITVLSKELVRIERRMNSIKEELIQTTDRFKLNQLADELVEDTMKFNTGYSELTRLYAKELSPVRTLIKAITKKK